jgi:hypothetical protein
VSSDFDLIFLERMARDLPQVLLDNEVKTLKKGVKRRRKT